MILLGFAALWMSVLDSTAGAAGLTWTATHIERTATLDQESIEAAFHFKNAGSDDVTILEIHSSCGCTTATLDKKTYAPGEEGDIQVKFTFGERSGPQQKEITVLSSDTPAKPTELILKVIIPEPFRVDPRLLIWKIDPADARPEPKSATIISANGQSLKVTKVTTDNADFEINLVSENEGQRWTLQLTPKSLAKTGKAVIRIQAESAEGRSHLLSIYGLVK